MSTTTAAGTYASTRVQTAVHLTNAIMGTFQHILSHLGLGASYLNLRWDTIEAGLRTWIAEGSLDDVRLECGDPNDPDAVFRVPLLYKVTGTGDINFVTSQARVTRALAKLQSVPAGSTYRVVVTFRSSRSPVPGWSATTAASTDGMASYALGSVGSGPDASASLTAHSRRS